MKQYLLVAAMIIIASSAIAQTGLFGLYYGEDCTLATENLEAQGFLLTNSLNTIKQFTTESSTYINHADLIINPETKKLACWRWGFDKNMTEDERLVFLNELKLLHGEDFEYEPELGLREWHQTENKSLILNFVLDEGKEIWYGAIYYDEDAKVLIYQAEDELFDQLVEKNKDK